MPTGARKVDLCFAPASMRTVMTSNEVRNISRNKPCDELTAGLKRPPLTLYNTHTFTNNENPKHNEMYIIGSELDVLGRELATCVPPKAKNKKRNVPTNSPVIATK